MLQPKFSNGDINRFIEKFQEEARNKFFEILRQTGEYAVTIAREEGRYIDHTGNLRSSIGYVIVDNGDITSGNFKLSDKGTDKKTGIDEGKRLAYTIAKEYQSGLVLVLVAGMDYAVYVEDMDNKDVITKAVRASNKYLKELLIKAIKYRS